MFTKGHQHHIHKVVHLKDRLKKLYEHLVIQAFAVSMVSVFVPIYLLDLGYPLTKVFTFLFIQWASFGLLAPLTGLLVRKVGIKEVILLRTPFFILALVMLTLLPTHAVLQRYDYLIAFLLGSTSVLYTLSITSLFAEEMDKRSEGKETSIFVSLPAVGTIIGPFVGGFLSVTFGFNALFLTVAVILGISIIPIFFINHNLDHPHFTLRELGQCYLRHRRTLITLLLYGMKGFALFILLPIVLYLQSDDALRLGIIMSVVSLISVLCSFVVGHALDRYGGRRILFVGGILNALFFLTLGLVTGTPLLIYLSLVAGLIDVLVNVPYETSLYDHAKRSPVAFLVVKETTLFVGRIALFLTLIFIADRLELGFYLGAASSFLLGLI